MKILILIFLLFGTVNGSAQQITYSTPPFHRVSIDRQLIDVGECTAVVAGLIKAESFGVLLAYKTYFFEYKMNEATFRQAQEYIAPSLTNNSPIATEVETKLVTFKDSTSCENFRSDLRKYLQK